MSELAITHNSAQTAGPSKVPVSFNSRTDDGPDSVPDNPHFFGKDGLGFGDLLDAVNPLQHIPVVNRVYRAITGDEISTGARLAGGALYGGPIGFATALADSVSLETSGKDLGQQVIAQVTGGGNSAPAPEQATPQAAPSKANPNRPPNTELAQPFGSVPMALWPTGTQAGSGRIAGAQPTEQNAKAEPPQAQAALPSLSPEAFQALIASTTPTEKKDEKEEPKPSASGSSTPESNTMAAALELERLVKGMAAR